MRYNIYCRRDDSPEIRRLLNEWLGRLLLFCRDNQFGKADKYQTEMEKGSGFPLPFSMCAVDYPDFHPGSLFIECREKARYFNAEMRAAALEI